MSARHAFPPVRACVSDAAVAKITRMFSSAIGAALAELLQNSRRSGASGVAVTAKTVNGKTLVAVADDGAGIADPGLLLAFGGSGWEPGIARAEDAAGMGFASLARRGCTVRSRAAGKPGWRLALEPDHFLGRKDARPEFDDTARRPHGAAVEFEADEASEAVRAALRDAARQYPLPVTFNGEALERKAFLDGAVHAEKWRGLVFGVFEERHTGYRAPDLNFHGLTLHAGLPRIEAVGGKTWTVRADVESCPELELVLPARAEAVENPFLKETRQAARLAVYKAMAAAGPGVRVSFEDWGRAARAGIGLPVPRPALRPWRPQPADIDGWRETPAIVPLGEEPAASVLLVPWDLDPPEAQALWRAATRAGVAGRLFEAEPSFEGYPWHRDLPGIESVSVHVDMDGKEHAPDDLPETGDDAARPNSIRIDLKIARGAGGETLSVPADLAFAGEAGSWIEDAGPLVAKDSDLAPDELALLLVDAFHSPSDDCEADSYRTQRDHAEALALRMATEILLSGDAALESAVAYAIWREILWLLPRGRDMNIAIRNGKVRAKLGPQIPPAA